jgi:hypothetical protein
MKFLATAAVIGIALVATAPVVHRSGSLYAQDARQPKEQPKPREPAGRQEPRPQPSPGRADAPGNERPAPPPPPPPKSTGEPELKRRNP